MGAGASQAKKDVIMDELEAMSAFSARATSATGSSRAAVSEEPRSSSKRRQRNSMENLENFMGGGVEAMSQFEVGSAAANKTNMKVVMKGGKVVGMQAEGDDGPAVLKPRVREQEEARPEEKADSKPRM